MSSNDETNTPALSKKSIRKLARKLANKELAKIARFWRKPGSAERLGSERPVNRQAAKDFAHKARRGR